jgi:hypothetical protein
MATNVGTPSVKVQVASVLFGGDLIDITPLVKTVSVSKSVSAEGTFSMVLTPDALPEFKNLGAYEYLNSNDYVEIALSGGYIEEKDTVYQGFRTDSKPVTVFRGFIGNVLLREAFQGNVPRTEVVVTGTDYMKVLAYTIQHYFRGDSKMSSVLQDAGVGSFLEGLKDHKGPWLLEVLMREMLSAVNDSKTLKNGKFRRGPLYFLRDFQKNIRKLSKQFTNYSNATNFRLSPIIFAYEGSFLEFLAMWAGLPWNEFTIQDFPDAYHPDPVLMIRPSPFVAFGNSLTPQDNEGFTDLPTTDPLGEVVTIPRNHIRSLELNKTDAQAFSYFLTRPVYAFTEMRGNEGELLYHTDNSHINKFIMQTYGYRPRFFDNYFTLDLTAEDVKLRTDILYRCKQFNNVAAGWNALNPYLESGTLVCRGNEEILPGRYITLPHTYGNRKESSIRFTTDSKKRDLYVMSVTHTWTAKKDFTSQVTVSRGQAYLEGVTTDTGRFLLSKSREDLTQQLADIKARYNEGVAAMGGSKMVYLASKKKGGS